MQNIEVELKFKLPNEFIKEGILNFLQENATFQKETLQKDTYFTASHKDLFAQPVNKWLRIRETSKGNIFNYKELKGNYCEEYETKIENPAEMEKILLAVGVKPAIIINKTRKSFLYHDIEISIDEVDKIGTFIELEMKGEYHSPKDAESQLRELTKKLSLNKDRLDKKGYLRLALEQKEMI